MIDTIYSDPNFLEHHGVKGMKWGVRKEPDDSVIKRRKRIAKTALAVGVTAGLAGITYASIKSSNASKLGLKAVDGLQYAKVDYHKVDYNKIDTIPFKIVDGGKKSTISKSVMSTPISDFIDKSSSKPWQETTELYNFKTGKSDKITYAKYAKDSFGHSEELYHYGVKGMKWGVRNEEESTGSRRKGLSPNAKRALKIGAGVAVAGLAVYGLYKTGTVKNATVSTIGTGSKVLGKSINDIDLKTVKNMNPTKCMSNCLHTSTGYIMDSVFGVKCTALYDYKVDEVSGMVFEKGGRYLDSLRGAFDNMNIKKYYDTSKSSYSTDTLPTVAKALKDIPNGSTGILQLVSSDIPDTHFVNYEKTKRGITTLIDCQNGSIYQPHKLGDSKKVLQFADFSQAIIREDADNVLKHMIKY